MIKSKEKEIYVRWKMDDLSEKVVKIFVYGFFFFVV